MKSRGGTGTFFNFVHWVPFFMGLLLILYLLTPWDGRLGHDFYHFFTRLSLGAIHFWQNGWVIPHYTPALCGGIPFFADPQSVYYSFPQFLVFFLDPITATLMTVTLFYFLGYWGFLKLLREVFGCGPRVSHFGALLFLFNGFSFAHFLVGHMTHHPYLLFPWLFYCLLKKAEPKESAFFVNVAVSSLIIVYTFYSGGMHMLVVFFAGLVLLSPFLVVFKWRQGTLGDLFRMLCWVVFFVLAACSGKLLASYLLSKTFVQSKIDSSGLGIFPLLKQYFWFVPGNTPIVLRFGQWHFGPWEYVGFVSKCLIPVTPLSMVLVLWRRKKEGVILIASYLILGSLFLLIGSGSSLNKIFPFFKSYHNPIKIWGAVIPLIILSGGLLLKRVSETGRLRPSSERSALLFFFVGAMILFSEYWGYTRFFLDNPLVYGFKYNVSEYRQMRAFGVLPPVTQVTSEYGKDLGGIAQGCTSLRCYEPMFGYRRDALKTTLVEGSTSLLREGTFNLTHPGCLIYPGHFKCKPWDRIIESDHVNFNLFVEGKTTSWGVPGWQRLLLQLGLATVLFLLLMSQASWVVPLWQFADVKVRMGLQGAFKRMRINLYGEKET